MKTDNDTARTATRTVRRLMVPPFPTVFPAILPIPSSIINSRKKPLRSITIGTSVENHADVNLREGPMSARPRAGQPADPAELANIPRLVTTYYAGRPDPSVPGQRVAFGTSGHRGSSLRLSFNEAHILAVTQAICDCRAAERIDGPLYLGMDTHALSEPAFATALEVLAGNGVAVMIDKGGGYTPTPAVSHAILGHNRGRASGWADGIVITPSHTPPEDGGL